MVEDFCAQQLNPKKAAVAAPVAAKENNAKLFVVCPEILCPLHDPNAVTEQKNSCFLCTTITTRLCPNGC